jgi:predicted P-loop ATPase
MEVVALAPGFLPQTGCVYGRESKPQSHWLYKSKFEKSIVFMDFSVQEKKKATLVEIRTNHQSMAPPSIHPCGEVLTWEGELGDLSEPEPTVLLRQVQLLATTALVARHYNPPGNRHDWGLCLAGVLYQLGLEKEETTQIFRAAGDYVHDSEFEDRVGTINSTYARSDDDPMKAAKALKELMPDNIGPAFLKSLSKIWGGSTSTFAYDGKAEKILANSQENIRKALAKLEVTLAFNRFSQKPEIKYGQYDGPLEDAVSNRIWLEIDKTFKFRPTMEFFDVVIRDTAYQNPFHPVQDYLKSLVWDREPRLDQWLIQAGEAADTEFVRLVSSIVLIAAVRRVMKPGCKFDEMLVLESDQGFEKSSVLRALCPNEDWFSDDLPLNVDAKQIIERTTGKWVIEAAELSGMGARNMEHLKAMLSRQIDGPVRMAYARLPISQPRQFVIIGTTNSHTYLEDPTGNRRFWPIRVKKFNIDLIRLWRDQLWAEATAREAMGESIRLSPDLYGHAAIQQERRRVEDPWEGVLSPLFDGQVYRTDPNEIYLALGIPMERRNAAVQKRINDIMQRLGFRRMTVKNKDGKPVKGWGKGEPQRGSALPYEATRVANPDEDM